MELTGEKSAAQSISDEQVLALASMAARLDEYMGHRKISNGLSLPRCNLHPAVSAAPTNGYQRTCPPRDGPGKGSRECEGARGVTAAPGVASGQVYIVKNAIDKLKFPDGLCW